MMTGPRSEASSPIGSGGVRMSTPDRTNVGLRRLALHSLPLLAIAALTLTSSARGQARVIGWGEQRFDSSWNLESYVEIDAGLTHTLARRADGSVVGWGRGGDGQCETATPPPGLAYVQIATGGQHSLALRDDGSVVA